MLKPFDAAWFFVEKSNAPAHFGPLVILSPPPDAGENFIRDFVADWRSHSEFAPPFNYRLAFNPLPSWQELPDSEIDLDYHLRHSALPRPGDERELGVLVSRLHSHHLDRKRPLWECHVIEGLEGGRFALYLKLHHGQLDGMGAAKLMQRVFSPDPDKRGTLPPWSIGMQRSTRNDKKPAPRPEKPGTLDGIRSSLGALPKVAGALSGLTRDAFGGKHPEVAVPFQAPNTVFNGRISAQRRFATQSYPLARLKRLAKAGNATMNDIFLSISGGAMRRYLRELDALPDKSLVGQVPVSIRTGDDDNVGNALAFVHARLGTDVEDPVQRLAAVRASTAAAKQRHESLPAAAVDPFTMLLMGPTMTQIILDLGGYVRPPANLVISNIAGPKERLYFNGARVEHIYGPSVLFHGQALNITMSSYVDEVNIGFTGCRTSLPSMQKLAVYTGDALDELEAALGVT